MTWIGTSSNDAKRAEGLFGFGLDNLVLPPMPFSHGTPSWPSDD